MTRHSDESRGRAVGVEYAREVWHRRRWTALVVFAAVFAAIASAAVALPDLYRATATVLVETQQVSEAFIHSGVTAELETRLPLIRQEVMSRARLTTLIGQLDLYSHLRQKGVPLDAIVETMRRDIDVDVKGVDAQSGGRAQTIAFAISYSGRAPGTVASVANALAALYVEGNAKIRQGQAVRTADFLKAQLDTVKQQLDAQERRTSDFKLRHIGELPQQVEANLASLDRLNTQLKLNGENQIRVMDRRERLQKQLLEAESNAPSPTVGPVRLSPRAEQLAKLRQQLADLRRQFTEEYPDVVRVRTQVTVLERELAGEGGATEAAAAGVSIDPRAHLVQSIAETDAELTALKDEEAAFRRAVTAYEQRVDNVPKRQEEYEALSRDYTTTKERYDTLLKRYEEAQLAERLEQGRDVEQLRILDPAIPPREAAAPGRLRLIAIGLFLAVGLAVAAAMAAEKFDTAFHDIDELRAYVGVPTLYSIPVIVTAGETRRQRRRMVLATATVLAALALIVTGSRHVATGNDQIVRLTSRGHV